MPKELFAIVIAILAGLFGCQPPEPGDALPQCSSTRTNKELIQQVRQGKPITQDQRECLGLK